jgi:osmotically-inducible protein OsmY
MKTVSEIENEIRMELNQESSMVATDVNITVKNGHVTLDGVADSYAKKIETERVVLRVKGVHSVTNNIILKIHDQRSDNDIKKTVLKMITWNSCIDETRIQVEVKNGWVTLSGDVDYDYQKSKAALLSEDIMGVSGVTNLIHVMPNVGHSSGKLTA